MADLIHSITKTWNRELMAQIFLPFKVERVMNIPLSSRLLEDTICWDLEKDGQYSVKSAYRALWGDSNHEQEASPSYVIDL